MYLLAYLYSHWQSFRLQLNGPYSEANFEVGAGFPAYVFPNCLEHVAVVAIGDEHLQVCAIERVVVVCSHQLSRCVANRWAGKLTPTVNRNCSLGVKTAQTVPFGYCYIVMGFGENRGGVVDVNHLHGHVTDGAEWEVGAGAICSSDGKYKRAVRFSVDRGWGCDHASRVVDFKERGNLIIRVFNTENQRILGITDKSANCCKLVFPTYTIKLHSVLRPYRKLPQQQLGPPLANFPPPMRRSCQSKTWVRCHLHRRPLQKPVYYNVVLQNIIFQFACFRRLYTRDISYLNSGNQFVGTWCVSHNHQVVMGFYFSVQGLHDCDDSCYRINWELRHICVCQKWL